MTSREKDLDKFFEALRQEKEAKLRDSLENPGREQTRLKWIEFQQAIQIAWLPVMEELMNVLGKLWFGYEMQLKGPEFRKELVPVPSYGVSHEIFGSMAVFVVAEHTWREREAPFEMERKTEYKTEVFKRGYRCRVVMKDDQHYEFQSDDDKILFRFENVMQVDQEKLMNLFIDAFLKGPNVIFNRWKTPLLPDGTPFRFEGDDIFS